MSIISLIVATAKNGVIGINNTLPWHLPEDLKRFKALTMGHHILMGRKTYESLGRLLPGRKTVIVTRNQGYKVEGAIIAYSLEEAIKISSQDDEIFLIGGAELYKAGLQFAQKIYLTEIQSEFAGDAFFPQLDLSQWEQISREKHTSEKGLEFAYITLQRKKP